MSVNKATVAALGTWTVITAIALYLAGYETVTYRDRLPAALPAALVNLLAMVIVLRCSAQSFQTRWALWIQLLSAFAVGLLLPFDFVLIYTVIWLAMAAGSYSLRTCIVLLVGVLVIWWAIQAFVWNESDALLSVALFATFHLFALLSARTAKEAEAARDEVEALNRELVATQHLLSEASRQNERTRIARDLHDLLGHHLTALSLNLQIAERLSDGTVKDRVAESRAIARLLLADVREAVSTLREEGNVDFAHSLQLLVSNVPELDVHIEIEDAVSINDVDVAESVLRCVQESITNTLRHADAKAIWVRVWKADDRIHLEVIDDGKLRGELQEGNGFAGMRERLQQLGGALVLDTAGDALRVRVDIPVTG